MARYLIAPIMFIIALAVLIVLTVTTNAVGPNFQGRNDTNTTDAVIAQIEEQNSAICGWIGVQVRPMTAPFAASLGMAVPYGAIFDQPEAGSPAARAGIEAGDVVTAINGLPLMRSSDFARMLAANGAVIGRT